MEQLAAEAMARQPGAKLTERWVGIYPAVGIWRNKTTMSFIIDDSGAFSILTGTIYGGFTYAPAGLPEPDQDEYADSVATEYTQLDDNWFLARTYSN